jgi:hypothetical protein
MNNPSETTRLLSFLGGQSAPRATDGIGRKLLCRCPACQRIWLQDGKLAHLDVPESQLVHIAQELSADLEHLPLLTCRLCLWRAGKGAVCMDEYAGGRGYGLCWELPDPLIHAQSSVLSLDWIRQADPGMDKPDIITRPDLLRAVLHWMSQTPPPRQYWPLDRSLCAVLASGNRPGFGQSGTQGWQWQGCRFALPCPPLEGDAMVVLAIALPPTETITLTTLFACWQMLAQVTLFSGVTGEVTLDSGAKPANDEGGTPRS